MSLCPKCENDYIRPSCECGFIHPLDRTKNEESTEVMREDFAGDFWGGYKLGVGLFSGCAGVIFKYTLLLALFGAMLRILFILLGIKER